MSEVPSLRGVVHGKIIELEQDAGFPSGQPVSVFVRPVEVPRTLGDSLKRSFGGWAEDAAAIDEYLKWNRQQRKDRRRFDGAINPRLTASAVNCPRGVDP